MTDEIKTDISKAETDAKSFVSKLKDDEIAAMGWVKAHVLYISIGGSLVLGFLIGHFAR